MTTTLFEREGGYDEKSQEWRHVRDAIVVSGVRRNTRIHIHEPKNKGDVEGEKFADASLIRLEVSVREVSLQEVQKDAERICRILGESIDAQLREYKTDMVCGLMVFFVHGSWKVSASVTILKDTVESDLAICSKVAWFQLLLQAASERPGRPKNLMILSKPSPKGASLQPPTALKQLATLPMAMSECQDKSKRQKLADFAVLYLERLAATAAMTNQVLVVADIEIETSTYAIFVTLLGFQQPSISVVSTIADNRVATKSDDAGWNVVSAGPCTCHSGGLAVNGTLIDWYQQVRLLPLWSMTERISMFPDPAPHIISHCPHPVHTLKIPLPTDKLGLWERSPLCTTVASLVIETLKTCIRSNSDWVHITNICEERSADMSLYIGVSYVLA